MIGFYLHVMPELEQLPSSQALCFVSAVMPSWNALCSDKLSSKVQPVFVATKAQAILPHDSSNHAHTGKTQISGFACAEGHQDDEIQFVF